MSKYLDFDETTQQITLKPVLEPIPGPKGDKGDSGAQGVAGTQGLKGDKGDAGTNGLTGPAGAIGPQGPKGDVGPSGSGTPNIGGVRWVTTLTEFTVAMADLTVRSINLAANITLTSTIQIPKDRKGIFEINGHGFDITVPSTVALGFNRTFNSLQEAAAVGEFQLRMTDVSFIGATSNNLMVMSANYGSRIAGCRFKNFSTALDLRWCMATVIDQCFFAENNIAINLDYDHFTGGSNSQSQSNHCVIQNCKFRTSAGQFAAIKINACSGTQILHNIFEGVQAGAQYEVYFDDAGSTVCKEFVAYGNHIEQIPSVAAFYIKLKQGYANIGGIFSQYDCTLVKFDSAAYARCIVKDIPYLTNGTKFENVNAAGRWHFENLPASFDPALATTWNGTAPIQIRIDNWNSNGQTPYTKLNNKNVLTGV